MSATAKGIVLDTWAGRRYYAVELVGETPKDTLNKSAFYWK